MLRSGTWLLQYEVTIMSKVCPKRGCRYEGTEHGVKVHYGKSEDHSGTLSDKYYKCSLCGSECYNDGVREAKFCSNECRHASKYDSLSDYWYRKVDVCERCEVVFEHPPSTKRKFCSRECSDRGRDDPGKERVVVECDGCGCNIKLTPSRVERSNNHYCSIECRGAGYYDGMVEVSELGLRVRSNWEKEFVLGLEKRNIPFQYERTFNLESRVYSPDFLVGDVVIEIKGWGRENDVERANDFMQEYPQYNYVVVQGSGNKLPADKWYSWSEKKEVYSYLDQQTGV